jgi:alginate export protein
MIFPVIPSAVFDSVRSLNLYIDDRERFERHLNPTFSSGANKNRSDLYTRLRLGVEYKASSLWEGRVEYQNADDLFWTHASNNSADSSDVSLAYAKYTSNSLTATGGRQRIELGQQRLIGSTPWLNLARSFDAGRAQYGSWDVWYGGIGVANTEPRTARVGAFTHSDKTWRDTSLIVKHDVGAKAHIDIETLDELVTHKFGNTTLDAEGALQYGNENGRDQQAWAWHARATQDLFAHTTLSLEADSSSGGGTGTVSRTFDNLYPSNHDLYGLADLVGWKNMNNLAIVLENKPCKDVTLRLEGHSFTLRDASDAWYSATGATTMIDATGKSGRNVGKELDFGASYAINHAGVISAGIALFQPGSYVQNVTGHSDHMTFGYLQFQTKF